MMHLQESEYYVIGEHKVIKPELPKSKKEIFFCNEKKADQYWDRAKLISEYRQIWFDFLPFSSKSPIYTKMYQSATIYDGDGLLISLNEEDSKYIEKIYLQEKHRRLNGVWFFNNGEPTWITGSHYMFLMWARMQRHDGMGAYADYRRFQADYARLQYHARISPFILGTFITKAKKTGITNYHWSGHYLNRATLFANKNFGYMNINSQQAAKTFNDYFMYSLNGLPSPLKPEVKLLSLVDGTIMFGQSYNGSKKVRKPNSENEDDLNSSVMCVATKAKAFDVAVMDEIAFDEQTKYKESFAEIWRTNKEAIKIQSKINGKATLFNYTEGEDTQSFREARDIFLESKLKTVTTKSNGQTQSGLICWHIPAYASWEGAFDKYGECDEQRAFSEIENERDKVKSNKRQLQTITRQYANTEREAWGSAGAGSTFDNIRLGDLLATIELDQKSDVQNNYTEGRLEWVNKSWEIGLKNKRPRGQFCPVEFIPLTKSELAAGERGRLRQYYEIPLAHRNAILKLGRDEWGNILRPDKFMYCTGGDPTNEAAASEIIEGSKNAYITMSRADDRLDSMMGKVASKMIMLEYFHRPEAFDEAYEDLVKQIIYTGSLNAIEANVPAMATRLMQEGLGLYMLIKNEDGVISFWERWMGMPNEPDKTYHLLRTTANGADKNERLEHFVSLMKLYFYEPEPGGKDYGAACKSDRILNQLMNIDVTNTKIYDLFMGLGYCFLADDIYSGILLNGQSDPYGGINMNSFMGAFSRA